MRECGIVGKKGGESEGECGIVGKKGGESEGVWDSIVGKRVRECGE